jgi:cyclin C
MNSQLIVHHPYRSLTDIQNQFSLNSEEISLAWSIVNDHYFTDLPLLHPPHVIAITAVFFAIVFKPNPGTTQAQNMQSAMQQLNAKTGGAAGAQPKVQNFLNWLAESAISIEAIVDCTQELISLYQVWEGFNEKECKEKVTRFVKARGLDK